MQQVISLIRSSSLVEEGLMSEVTQDVVWSNTKKGKNA